MAKRLKGIKELEQVFTAYAKQFGIKKVRISDDCCYWRDSKTIDIKIYEDITDEWFNQFVSDRFDIVIGSSLLIGLLHEIGHHETLDEISDTVQSMCDEEKDRIEALLKNEEDEHETARLEWQYFNLPDEIMATYWAVDYIRANIKEVNRVNKIFKKAYKDFCILNNITED